MAKHRNKRAADRPSNRTRLVWYVVFLIYLAITIYLLIDATASHNGEPGVNLRFFSQIWNYWLNVLHGNDFNRNWGIQNLFGNIAIFIPFGFLVPLVSNRRFTGFKTALAAIITVSAVETYQLITKTGVFDVDDFILNWSGVLIGWLIYQAVQGLRRLIKRKDH